MEAEDSSYYTLGYLPIYDIIKFDRLTQTSFTGILGSGLDLRACNNSFHFSVRNLLKRELRGGGDGGSMLIYLIRIVPHTEDFGESGRDTWVVEEPTSLTEGRWPKPAPPIPRRHNRPFP